MKSSDHRNLDGFYTDVFWLRERKKSLEESLTRIRVLRVYRFYRSRRTFGQESRGNQRVCHRLV